jgi:hypothetical protein
MAEPFAPVATRGIYNSLRTMRKKEDKAMGTDTKALQPTMECILKAAVAAPGAVN